MSEEKYTEVTVGGRTYRMSGSEDSSYLQEVASYLNGKISEMETNPGWRRLPADERNLMLMMNLADDYFREKNRCEMLESKTESMEDDIDDLRHELVRERMQNERDHDETGSESGPGKS